MHHFSRLGCRRLQSERERKKVRRRERRWDRVPMRSVPLSLLFFSLPPPPLASRVGQGDYSVRGGQCGQPHLPPDCICQKASAPPPQREPRSHISLSPPRPFFPDCGSGGGGALRSGLENSVAPPVTVVLDSSLSLWVSRACLPGSQTRLSLMSPGSSSPTFTPRAPASLIELCCKTPHGSPTSLVWGWLQALFRGSDSAVSTRLFPARRNDCVTLED